LTINFTASAASSPAGERRPGEAEGSAATQDGAFRATSFD